MKHMSDPRLDRSSVVIDPMCGSGTVLGEACAAGFTVRGYDVDPLAVLMSRVATSEVDITEVLSTTSMVLREARVASAQLKWSEWQDEETRKFAEFWFGASQRAQLHTLSYLLACIESQPVRECLQVALSRIIITKSPRASLAADTAHSRPHRVISDSDYDVFAGFAKSAHEITKLLSKRVLRSSALVERGDARKVNEPDCSVDLIVTSPPYLNAIDYMRGHKLALVWLGYNVSQLRKIRRTSIGAERAPDYEVDASASALVEWVRTDVTYPLTLPMGTINRYAHDLGRFSSEMFRICRPGGTLVTVIGNSTLKGNYVRNDQIVRRSYSMSGFKYVSRSVREIPDNRRYLPMTQSGPESLSKRMRSEVVLTVKKPV